MIEFNESRIPEKRLTTLTAYISESDLASQGKRFAIEVVSELIRKSVYLHTNKLQEIITELILSDETRTYIQERIRVEIDREIKEQIKDMFKRE